MILESKQVGMVVVLGNFNAHLQSLASAQDQGDPNTQGIFVEKILKRCKLYMASQSEIVLGPQYKYLSIESDTVVTIFSWMQRQLPLCLLAQSMR